jgi:dimethylargininase
MKTQDRFDSFSHVLTCRPEKTFVEGIAPAIGIPDYNRALLQHGDYCAALEKCGVTVIKVPSDPAFPDSCFINDTAVVTKYVAVIGNFPATHPRQGEQQAVASALIDRKFLKFITGTGYLDAADVLRVENHFYIGLSAQTNEEGAAQLGFFLKDSGYDVTVLDLREQPLLRLNTAACALGSKRLLIREELAAHYAFLEYEKIIVPYQDRGAVNAVMVNGTLIMPAGYRQALATVKELGIPVIEVNISEFEKMNGGLNCLALRVPPTEKTEFVRELPQQLKGVA